MFRVLVLLLGFVEVLSTPGNPVRPDYRWANPEAVKKWHDMKFGLRIHWGEYAITAIGPESWPLNRNAHNQTFLKWYWNQYKNWNPKKYNATAWIEMMKMSGIKFFDFTTKHHEGFSMYDTNTRVHDCWDFDVTPGATHIKGIVPCVPPSTETYTKQAGTKSTATGRSTLQNVSVAAAQAACSADPACACFDYYEVDDAGNRCGAPGGCATLKDDASSTAADRSNTLYVKGGGDPSPDGIAYSSMSSFGRDVVGELVAAAREGGIKPGLYFSNIDWFDPDMRIDEWNPVAHVAKLCGGLTCDPSLYNRTAFPSQWRRFVLRHRAQVMEVLTKYGEIVSASLDMHFPDAFDEDITDTIMLARQLAPNTLFRGRGIGGKREDGGYGDYDTPEETFPDKPIPGNWQVIYHGSNFMSYDPDPSHYVSGDFIIWHLADIVSKGGLMQIGYGPDRDGEFHPLAVKALAETGAWLRVNGEAIYGTRAMPLHWNDTASTFVRYTRAKDNTTVYAIALTGSGGPKQLPPSITLACVVPAKGSRVQLLGHPGGVQWTRSASGKTVLSVPKLSGSKVVGPGYVFKMQGSPAESC